VTRFRRGPRSLSAALDELRSDLAPATLLADVQRAWPGVVGEAISSEATPTAERAGVVTISCSAAVWAQELDLMSSTIIARLKERLGGREIVRLRCVSM
jgi:predicted nucleic acid-binding Zn ribbon protein